MNRTVELNTRMVKHSGINRNQVSVLEKKELVTHSCLTLCSPMDCTPPGSSVHGILQARILEWVAIPSSRGSSQPRDQTQGSSPALAGRFFTTSTTWASRC